VRVHRLFGRSAIAVLLTAIAGKAGVASEVSAPSIQDRVAAIRAKVAQLSTARLHDVVTPAIGQPARVAWNDWKNE